MQRSRQAINREAAEVIGIQALGWLATQDDILMAFLGATGASMDDLRRGATDHAFLASVLGFLGNDDDWIRAFCDEVGLPYEQPMLAMQMLAGPSMMHWT
ncbi:conserved hypothetical protein [Ketogulonicigenium vulgare Y25]|uniref:DUF3572 family protein n=2 Tax=Ketogulonicigenium vulgare TaxID=92945 RepID=F9Y3E4_KETVW|nr:DUF3572 domain-containing protein [Ketogulonicigenium vulgare]ADO42181.1 conserved hypothetical protein [Ketogulonicigenium vulgare Y25]AEM40385.1 hypothetical protein KVU_0546 [Ketogulonicigenium vulgare WSH-001]ALJ80572.1 hypothetical protein KVH_04915 [Ketogulonicigenium vulgare]AOZ54098.1 hypothetical protein KVC_1081 [Ketogulonicigenium vulgare]